MCSTRMRAGAGQHFSAGWLKSLVFPGKRSAAAAAPRQAGHTAQQGTLPLSTGRRQGTFNP